MQLQSISIKNFRGFDRLTIDGFSSVNILLGKNNCGKTSVLEAIFLLSGMSNPMLAVNLHRFRGSENVYLDEFKYLFHKFDASMPPMIFGKFTESVDRQLSITAIYGETIDIDRSRPANPFSAVKRQPIKGLNFESTVTTNGKIKSAIKTSLTFNTKEKLFEQSVDYSYKEDVVGLFIHANAKDNGLAECLSELVKDKKEHVINSLLSQFDGQLKSVYPLPEGIFVDKEGVDERMPLSLMGDGIRRFLNIAATIASSKSDNFICSIDEIENGLHYTAQQVLWKSILSLVRSTNVQLFITTHSEEMLSSLENVLVESEYSDMQKKVKTFTIDKTIKKGFQAYSRSFDGMKFALDNGIEIR